MRTIYKMDRTRQQRHMHSSFPAVLISFLDRPYSSLHACKTRHPEPFLLAQSTIVLSEKSPDLFWPGSGLLLDSSSAVHPHAHRPETCITYHRWHFASLMKV